MSREPIIGVIGGSGLYQLEGLSGIERIEVDTPYGPPSDPVIRGELAGKTMIFLPRHGLGHRLLPHEINFRANIWALKQLGVSQLLSVSAVGSMKEDIAPGKVVFIDQLIDLTKRRASTFYGEGVVTHVPMADPIDPIMRGLLAKIASELNIEHVDGGTYVCIEGPQFSTRAESLVYRSWGVDVIGMTNMPEAKLAREAEMGYATIALATDYDCWHHSEEDVSVEAVLQVLASNVDKAKRLIAEYARQASAQSVSAMSTTAARSSLMTPADAIDPETRTRLAPILSWL